MQEIKLGDRVTYKVKDTGEIRQLVYIELSEIEDMQKALKNNNLYEIIKIERPEYKVVEEKKELLTEEEKELLKLIRTLSLYKIDSIERYDYTLKLREGTRLVTDIVTNKFLGLENKRKYTFSELGLEE